MRFFLCFLFNVAATKNGTKYCHRIRPKVNLAQLLKETNKMRDDLFLASVVNGRDAKPRKKAPSFCSAVLRCFNSIEVPSSRGGRSEAQHNPPRCSHLLPACWAASCRKTSPKGFRTDKVSSLGACTHRPFAKVAKTLVKPHF